MKSYHPTSKTTYNIRKEIHDNIENLTISELSKKYNVSPPTIKKWQNRDKFEDAPHGARKPKKSISDLEEYVICEIRKIALLPLDDLLDVVTELGIKITRSALNRALQRNGISRLNEYIQSLEPKEKSNHEKFKNYEPGFIHIDIKYLPKIDGKQEYLYVAIDRATRVVYVEIYPDKGAESTSTFLTNVTAYYPFDIQKVLTDNGKEFTDKFNNKEKKPTGNHPFDKVCKKENIEHRLTKPYTPKTNGMVERVNRKVSENVLKKVKFDSSDEMKSTIFQYFYNYNFYIKHSSIGRKTPIEMMEQYCIDKPDIFNVSLNEFKLKNKSNLDNYKARCNKY